jgi:hypothetical protein
MDLFWIGLTVVLVAASLGLIALCDRTGRQP